jgi:aminobenzoyl-glutamate utilization protein B
MRGLLLPLLLPICAEDPPPDAREAALAWIDQSREVLTALSRFVWEAAEVGLEEVESSAALSRYLEERGFRVERGIAGMPTAFVASRGSGRPVVALLAEYDALPALSQKAEPKRAPRVEGGSGHACGHNLFGAASVGAAAAAARAMEVAGLAGTVRVYGTPAEETGIGKTFLAKEGRFDDCDAVLHWHPSDRTGAAYETTKAVVSVKIRFRGLPAHASLSPEDGRSALDAVELTNVAANYLREHLPEDARIHYVVTEGGGQPNVVPPDAEVWYYLRADSHRIVERMFERLRRIVDGAALMTETTPEIRVDSDTHEILPNRPLAEILQRNLEAVGAPRFDEAERAFARETQAPIVEARGEPIAAPLAETIQPLLAEPERMRASTDVGEVSWRVPTGGLRIACYTFGAPGHSWQIVACGGMSIGEKGMIVAAKTLAATALDLLADPKLLDAARADFEKRKAGKPLTSLLPPQSRAPARIR